MANSERRARGMEVCGVAFLSGKTFLRIFVQYDSDIYGLAPYAAGVARGDGRDRRMDMGSVEAAQRADPSWRDLLRRLCSHGEHPGAYRNDHGRAAGLSSVRRFLPAGGTRMELAARPAEDGGSSSRSGYHRGLWHAYDGSQPGLEGQYEPLFGRSPRLAGKRKDARQLRRRIPGRRAGGSRGERV